MTPRSFWRRNAAFWIYVLGAVLIELAMNALAAPRGLSYTLGILVGFFYAVIMQRFDGDNCEAPSNER